MAVRRTRVLLLAALCAAVLACGLALAGCSTIRAGRILRDAVGPAAALEAEVSESEENVPCGAQRLRVRIVRPRDAQGPLPAFLLVHGAAQGGPDDPRMVAFARALAVRGATVACLELPALMRLRIDAADPGRIVSAATWLAERADLSQDGRTALIGVSVGGSYAIRAACDPTLAGRVAAVLAFGAYSDLEALLVRWMTESGRAAPGLHDPFKEGRRLVLLGNVDRLVPPGERGLAERRIRALLDGKPILSTPRVSDETARVIAAAESEAPIRRDAADALLVAIRDDMASLSPVRAQAVPAAPVFLLHADSDPVVPTSDASAIRDALAARGADVRLHVTDLFGHVDPADDGGPGIVRAWPLMRFVAAFLDAAGM
jgi:acetyl esterase/lipase